VPWTTLRARARVLHEPHYVLPLLTPCRSVVTIHDCIHLRFPQYLPTPGASAYARMQMGAAARKSDRILTVSDASKKDILEYFDVPPEKITVIYNGIDERFLTEPADEAVRHVAERYQLEGEFVLYVGNVKPHKNVERLIDAFNLVRQAGHDEVRLVVIGDEISKNAALRRAVHRHNLHKHVRFLGFLPDEMLAVVYRLAAVFVFPSLYEGFGLPPLEAMACGTPVITSNVSSLPEVTGGAALLVDQDEKAQVATIDLRAGRKAKASAAYASARAYFSAGMALLDERDWAGQYELNAAGSIALEFTLPLNASDMANNTLVLHMNGRYAGNPRFTRVPTPGTALGQIFLYNWQSSDWDAQDFAWGDNAIGEAGPYMSATNSLRLRYTYKPPTQQPTSSLQFSLDLTDEGQLR